MKRRVDRRRRGVILLLVLALLLVMTLVGASLIRVTGSQSMALRSAAQQSLAILNSQMGTQEGVARLRTGTILAASLPTCLDDVASCSFAPPTIDDSATPRRYRVFIYRRTRSLQTTRGSGTPNVIVASVGCAGFNAAATCGDTASFTALTEVEVQLPQAGGQGSGTYGDD
jgi:hypothetical protein